MFSSQNTHIHSRNCDKSKKTWYCCNSAKNRKNEVYGLANRPWKLKTMHGLPCTVTFSRYFSFHSVKTTLFKILPREKLTNYNTNSYFPARFEETRPVTSRGIIKFIFVGPWTNFPLTHTISIQISLAETRLEIKRFWRHSLKTSPPKNSNTTRLSLEMFWILLFCVHM